MKKCLIILSVLLLTACKGTPAEHAHDMVKIQSQLPKGCKVGYLGTVSTTDSKHESRIFFTKCDNITTISETHTVPTGKTSYEETTTNVIEQ